MPASAAIQTKVSQVLDGLGLVYSTTDEPEGVVHRIVYPDCVVAVGANEYWITFGAVAISRFDPSRANAILAVNGKLALAKLGTEPGGRLLAGAHVRHADLDARHVSDALAAVNAAVAVARQALGVAA